MNIRKNIDYSDLYAGIDKTMTTAFSQMELYLELGRLVSGRPEKGAAVMAAEYITASYPDRTGFSPRNLRRMRDFFQMYEGYPEILEQAMEVGWTQNIVIMEADLDIDARSWYLLAIQRFGWSKAELAEQIIAGAHLEAGSEDELQDNNLGNPIEKTPAWTRILQSFTLTVDFPKRFWYNMSWRFPFLRQFGIMGEAYG